MDTIEWLARLIAFDTTSRNSNLQLIELIRDWFEEHQLSPHLIFDHKEPKANLFATIPAYDGNTKGGIILSGHTDVVPVDGQTWDSNPFEATIHHERVYGRGACDMKGFIAVLLKLLPTFCTLKLTKPIHFAFSYDEEVGCLGMRLLVNHLNEQCIEPEGCVVGEPTNMQPVTAHKGRALFRCRINGAAAHSSLTTKGCNAIEHAAQLICYLRGLAEQFKKQQPFDKDFDIPFTTLTTNMIEGGNAHNIIPEFCEFLFEFRFLPQTDPQKIIEKINDYIQTKLLPTMREEYANSTIDIIRISGGPGLNTSENEMITKLIRQVTGVKKTYKVAFATEAGIYQRAKIPTVICGPGSIEQAHQANEFVTIDQLKECEKVLTGLVNYFAIPK